MSPEKSTQLDKCNAIRFVILSYLQFMNMIKRVGSTMPFQVGDILFVRGDSWFSPIIKWVLRSEFSHVAVAIGPNQICEIDIFKRMRIIDNPYKDYEVYRYRGGLTKQQKQQLVDYLKEKCKTTMGYDYPRILSILFQILFKWHIVIDDKNRFICSEIIDAAYQHIGIDLIQARDTGDVTPPDLLNAHLEKAV
jgi:hypothetical protein